MKTGTNVGTPIGRVSVSDRERIPAVKSLVRCIAQLEYKAQHSKDTQWFLFHFSKPQQQTGTTTDFLKHLITMFGDGSILKLGKEKKRLENTHICCLLYLSQLSLLPFTQWSNDMVIKFKCIILILDLTRKSAIPRGNSIYNRSRLTMSLNIYVILPLKCQTMKEL